MDDPAFELKLGRLFGEHPALPDATLFARTIEDRLGRGWAFRNVLIVAAGVIGGGITVVQVMGSGLAERVESFTRMASSTRQGLEHVPLPLAPQFASLSEQLPYGGEVMWLVLGLAGLAGALLVSRTLEER